MVISKRHVKRQNLGNASRGIWAALGAFLFVLSADANEDSSLLQQWLLGHEYNRERCRCVGEQRTKPDDGKERYGGVGKERLFIIHHHVLSTHKDTTLIVEKRMMMPIIWWWCVRLTHNTYQTMTEWMVLLCIFCWTISCLTRPFPVFLWKGIHANGECLNQLFFLKNFLIFSLFVHFYVHFAYILRVHAWHLDIGIPF